MIARQLETARLRLRPFLATDTDELHRLWIDPYVRRYLWDDLEITRDRAETEITHSTESFNNRGFGFWAVFFKEDDTNLIGFCGLRVFGTPEEVEILYGIHPSHWGKGLATEASAAVIHFGFQVCRLPKIYAGADAPNTASFRVMEKLGMTYDGLRIVNGLEAVYYCLSNSSYNEVSTL
ncbi:MAG TPA: GNAT family N-acetyltransferase [Pyrinomonadaceae bacterium]|nr:GNAT family N-acetyltransferase [Pyrinomonadaceae bacterium]